MELQKIVSTNTVDCYQTSINHYLYSFSFSYLLETIIISILILTHIYIFTKIFTERKKLYYKFNSKQITKIIIIFLLSTLFSHQKMVWFNYWVALKTCSIVSEKYISALQYVYIRIILIISIVFISVLCSIFLYRNKRIITSSILMISIWILILFTWFKWIECTWNFCTINPKRWNMLNRISNLQMYKVWKNKPILWNKILNQHIILSYETVNHYDARDPRIDRRTARLYLSTNGEVAFIPRYSFFFFYVLPMIWWLNLIIWCIQLFIQSKHKDKMKNKALEQKKLSSFGTSNFHF